MNTKQKICQVAMTLFEERGFKQVSLREIAKEAGTTIGNMTYHFPKKEDLVIAIQQNLHTDYLKELEDDEDTNDLQKLYNSFERAYKNQQLNPFYYQNIVELTLEFESIAERNRSFRARLHTFYLVLFRQLADQGLFLKENDEVFEALVFSIVLQETMWIQQGSPYYDASYQQPSIFNYLATLIRPYLTEKGFVKWQDLMKVNP